MKADDVIIVRPTYGHPAPEHVYNLMLAYQSTLLESAITRDSLVLGNKAIFRFVAAMKSAETCFRSPNSASYELGAPLLNARAVYGL